MSAVDMSSDLDVMMEVAIYMAQLGLDRRALQLFREVAFANPLRPEPYALGLASAKRLGRRGRYSLGHAGDSGPGLAGRAERD